MTDLFSSAAAQSWTFIDGQLEVEEAAGIEIMFDELGDRTHDRRSWTRETDGRTVTITVWRSEGLDRFLLRRFSGEREVIGERPTS